MVVPAWVQTLAPFEYTGLIWSALLGYVFFQEIPGWRVYAGAGIINDVTALRGDPRMAALVAEGAGENIFVIKDGVIYTPDLSAGALNGITRNTVFHIAKDLGLEIVQKRITRDEVYIADEAFFTGTAAEVTPIRELDRIEIGAGSRGPITEKIQSAFFDIVNGRNPKYAEWLTKV